MRALAAGLLLLLGTSAPTVTVRSVVNHQGIVSLTLACGATADCTGTYALPEYDGQAFPFTVAAGATKTFTDNLPGPSHAASEKKTTVRVVLTQTTDTEPVTSDRSYRFVQASDTGPGGGGSGDQHNGNDGPHITAGPKSSTQTVRDPRGDARSSFQLPILFDIVSASAKRSGRAIVFTITTVQPIGTLHDSFGNPSTPCIEIPHGSATDYPIFLFGNGQIPMGRGRPTPKVPVSIRGTTIRWTVPKKYLFTLGFLWRATGGCDASHVADVAPQSGFKTFRWVAVKKP